MGKTYKQIAKLLTFWIPISSVRRNLRSKIISIRPSINTDFFDELILKYDELQLKKENIDTIVLGSSHAAAGFIPKQFSITAFNLASASQDLYYSCQLLKYCQKELKNLKNIYLFYSVFSSGFELQKTNEKERCAFFKFLFNIPYKYDTDNKLEYFYKQTYSYYKKNKKNIDTNGYIEQKNFFPSDYPINERAKTHLRENQRENNQMDYLQKIIEICTRDNINLKIIIPPLRNDFYNLLPDENILFAKLYQQDNLPEIFSFWKNEIFMDSDFGDFDHLNKQGAIKLTNLIKEKIGLNK